MSKIIKLHKIEQGVCPYCGSETVAYDSMEIDGDSVYYPVHCDTCGRDYEEWYNLTFAGHNVGDDKSIITSDGETEREIEVED